MGYRHTMRTSWLCQDDNLRRAVLDSEYGRCFIETGRELVTKTEYKRYGGLRGIEDFICSQMEEEMLPVQLLFHSDEQDPPYFDVSMVLCTHEGWAEYRPSDPCWEIRHDPF